MDIIEYIENVNLESYQVYLSFTMPQVKFNSLTYLVLNDMSLENSMIELAEISTDTNINKDHKFAFKKVFGTDKTTFNMEQLGVIRKELEKMGFDSEQDTHVCNFFSIGNSAQMKASFIKIVEILKILLKDDDSIFEISSFQKFLDSQR